MATLHSWETGPLPDTVVGDITLDTEYGIPTAPSIKVGATSGAAFSHWSVDDASIIGLRTYFRTPSVWPSTSCNLVSFRAVDGSQALVLTIAGMGAPGQFRMVRLGGTVAANSSNGLLTVDTVYRVEGRYDATNGRARSSIWTYGGMDPIWDSGWVEHSDFSTSLNRLEIGRPNTTPLIEYNYDSVLIVDDVSTNLPRHAGDTPIEIPPTSYPITWETGPLPDNVVGDITLDTEYGIPTAPSIKVGATSGAAFSHWSVDDASTIGLRTYFRTPSVWPTTSCNLISFRSVDGSQALVLTIAGVSAPGQFRMVRLGGTVVDSSAHGLLTVDTVYRVEGRYDAANGRARSSIWTYGGTDPIWDSGWVEHSDFSTNLNRLEIGRPNNTPLIEYNYDSVLIVNDVSTNLPRHAGDTPIEIPPTSYPITWDSDLDTSGSLTGGAVTDPLMGLPTSPAVLIPEADGASNLMFTVDPVGVVAARWYFTTPEVWPSLSYNMGQLRQGGTAIATFTVSGSGQPGQVRLVKGGGVVLASAPQSTISVGTAYRAEIQYDKPNTRARVAVFRVGRDNPTWTSNWITDATFVADVDGIYVGRMNTNPVVGDFHIDSIELSDEVDDWIGRHADDAFAVGPTGTFKVWNGTSLVPVNSVSIWNGSTLVPVNQARLYN